MALVHNHAWAHPALAHDLITHATERTLVYTGLALTTSRRCTTPTEHTNNWFTPVCSPLPRPVLNTARSGEQVRHASKPRGRMATPHALR